jgi:hypothetical protein
VSANGLYRETYAFHKTEKYPLFTYFYSKALSAGFEAAASFVQVGALIDTGAEQVWMH